MTRSRKPALAKVGVKVDPKAKEVTSLAGDLQGLVVSQRVGDASERTAIELRDRAATYLFAALREVRAAARGDTATRARDARHVRSMRGVAALGVENRRR